jgi:hypothetical protein
MQKKKLESGKREEWKSARARAREREREREREDWAGVGEQQVCMYIYTYICIIRMYAGRYGHIYVESITEK